MSQLLARLQADLTTARKAQDKTATLVVGTLLSEVKNRRIELQRDLTDEDVVDAVRKAMKKRRESVEMYTKAARVDLAAKEQAEADSLAVYLPPQVDPEELRAAVRAAIADGKTTIGAVMGAVLPKFKGRAEGGEINAIAREELAPKA